MLFEVQHSFFFSFFFLPLKLLDPSYSVPARSGSVTRYLLLTLDNARGSLDREKEEMDFISGSVYTTLPLHSFQCFVDLPFSQALLLSLPPPYGRGEAP